MDKREKFISMIERSQAATEQVLDDSFKSLIGNDPNFKAVLYKAQKAAKSDFAVLILGESGTGKEILARTIHQTSMRNKMKFVDINCAAIPDQLIDSELFGYEKGSFTGATQSGRDGLFLEAHNGTLFLDEIADASLQTQVKLLRVLNEGYFRRIGSTKNSEVNVRIIAATNKDLRQEISEKKFRDDLFYRLNTITINLPALRERKSDIPILAEFFLNKHKLKRNCDLQFTDDCMEMLMSYSWPGNVRELKSIVDYALTMSDSPIIDSSELPNYLMLENQVRKQEEPLDDAEMELQLPEAGQNIGLYQAAVQAAEKKIIMEILKKTKNKSMAIKILGISRRTFYSKLKQYNLYN